MTRGGIERLSKESKGSKGVLSILLVNFEPRGRRSCQIESLIVSSVAVDLCRLVEGGTISIRVSSLCTDSAINHHDS